MSEDPYTTLGVDRSASQAEIKKAYRRLAKSLHPDLHPDDPDKQNAFQSVSAAYDLLGDPEKRRRFDAGEIDASGQERAEPRFYHQYASGEGGRRYDAGFGGREDDMSDLFADLFGGARGSGTRHEVHARGPDMRYHVEVDFLDAATGAKRIFTMPDGNRIEITIPAGLRDGQTLRLKGKGGPGYGRGPAGDALVTVGVRPDPTFTRTGNDVEVEVPVTFDEAVLGARIEVPTISGPVSMTVPEGSSSGRRLRLRGRGIADGSTRGDQVVRLRIVLPDTIDAEMRDLARRWRERAAFDPRSRQGRRT